MGSLLTTTTTSVAAAASATTTLASASASRATPARPAPSRPPLCKTSTRERRGEQEGGAGCVCALGMRNCATAQPRPFFVRTRRCGGDEAVFRSVSRILVAVALGSWVLVLLH